MDVLRLNVPTYNGNAFPEKVANDEIPEFGPPYVPVGIHEAGGVRVVLGSHDTEALDRPDIQIERRPGGWAIFLHPLGGSDASGMCTFLTMDGVS